MRTPVHIRDVFNKQQFTENYNLAMLRTEIATNGRLDVCAELHNASGVHVASAQSVIDMQGALELNVEHPRLWSADSPALYDLYLFAADETLWFQVGFREIDIENGVFRINGYNKY